MKSVLSSAPFKRFLFISLCFLSFHAHASHEKSPEHSDILKANTWSIEYGFSRQQMSGLLRGIEATNSASVLQNTAFKKLPYPGSHDCKKDTDPCLLTTIAERRQVDVHKLLLSYHQTNELTWSVEFQYLSNNADMVDKMGPTLPLTPYQLVSNGVGDVQLSLTKQFAKTKMFDVDLTLGLSLPLGNIDKPDGIPDMTGNSGILNYDMQLGSGTYDLITELAINGKYYGLEYGSSVNRITRTGFNNQYYNLGDKLKLSAWSRYTFWFGTQLRLGATQHVWSPVQGRDLRMSYNPLYSGGKRFDALIGLGQKYKSFSVFVDYSRPLLQYLNGVQIKSTGQFFVGVKLNYL